MSRETKPTADKESTWDRLEIRVGRVESVEQIEANGKPSYKLRINFGKFGDRHSVGRFTQHSADALRNRLVVGVLNFGDRVVGGVLSEVLILGVQYRGAASGEATFLTPAAEGEVKLGSKVF